MPPHDPAPGESGAAGSDRVLIVGCGASLRRDDQVGLRVAETLIHAGLPSPVQVKSTESPCVDLLEELAERRDVGLFVVIDAAGPDPGRSPGTWCRIDARQQPHRIQKGDRSNVHGLSVDAAFEIAAAMGLLPPNVWVYVVAAGEIGYGEEMTPAVSAAVAIVAARIVADVNAWLGSRGDRSA
jgi:hydrogenase maturation protease